MKRIILYSITVVLLGFLMGGCKGKKSMLKKEGRITKSDDLIKDVSKQEINYQTIEIKSSTKAEMDGKRYSLNITYRNKKDETIWVSVRAMLGIEVARLIANRDSVWVVSKIAKTKEKGSWQDMGEMLGYPVDFMAFQNIMTRKLFYPGEQKNDKLKSFIRKDEKDGILLVPDYSNEKQRLDSDNYGFLPKFIIGKKKYSINRTSLAPEDNEWLFEVEYQGDTMENMGLGKNIKIKAMDAQSNIELDLKIQEININEAIKVPFQWF